MEEEIKKTNLEDLENSQEPDYVTIIKSFYSHVEETEFSDSNVLKNVKTYVPVIRVGVYRDAAFKKLSDTYTDELEVYNAHCFDFDYEIPVDDKGIIISIPPELDELQRLKARQAEEHEKLISLKTALFDHLNIKHDSSKLEDKLHVKKSDFLDCVNFKKQANRVNDDAYEELYKKNLDAFLNLIPKNENFFITETNAKRIGDVLVDFDNFMRQMLRYHFEIKGGTPNQYDAKPFAGLSALELKEKISASFKPEVKIDVNPEIHAKNHMAFIEKTDKNTLDSLSTICDESATNVVKTAQEKLKNATTAEEKKEIKINTLLNVREYFLTQRKIYKSHPWYSRRWTKTVRPYRDKYDKLFASLVNLGMDKKFVQSFLNNKVTKINVNDKVYDYNKIYNENDHFKSELESVNNVYREHTKQQVTTDIKTDTQDKKFENVITTSREKNLKK